MSAPTISKATAATRASEAVTPLPTLDEIIAQIQSEALAQGVTIDGETAAYIDDMFARVAAYVNEPPYAKTYLLDREDMRVAHPVLDTIIADDTLPKPGSAHELLNLRHLKGDQLTFVHTTAEGRGIDRYCAVAIAVDSTNAA